LHVVPSATLKATAIVCLASAALLALAVAHSRAPYSFESPVIDWLGPPSAVGSWSFLAELLAAPAIGAALVVSVAVGYVRGGLVRVVVYTGFAGAALLVSEHVAKPLVQRSYYGELTFPSGNVTAVSAIALALWLALGPRLGKVARRTMLGVGVAWVLCMSLAMVGALWHTPLDDVESILLSVGIVTGGGAVFESVATRRSSMSVGRAPARRRAV
jgi:hypothetical protein